MTSLTRLPPRCFYCINIYNIFFNILTNYFIVSYCILFLFCICNFLTKSQFHVKWICRNKSIMMMMMMMMMTNDLLLSFLKNCNSIFVLNTIRLHRCVQLFPDKCIHISLYTWWTITKASISYDFSNRIGIFSRPKMSLINCFIATVFSLQKF